MLETDIDELIEAARSIQGSFALGHTGFSAGAVGAALRTRSEAIYTGVCIDLACGIGFCAEHAAVAEMLKNRELEIAVIVAVAETEILPPCGRCRELMAQLSPRNATTRVVLPGKRVVELRDLLPEYWMTR